MAYVKYKKEMKNRILRKVFSEQISYAFKIVYLCKFLILEKYFNSQALLHNMAKGGLQDAFGHLPGHISSQR